MNKHIVSLSTVLLLLTACTRQWADHNAVTDAAVTFNVFERIQRDTALQGFTALLKQTGYDSVLASSRSYTVWAPDNQAVKAIAPAVLNNDSLLRLLVASHISYQSYRTTEPSPSLRLATLSGKYYEFTATGFDGNAITRSNGIARNGIVHTLSGAVTPKPTIWQTLLAQSTDLRQRDYLVSLNHDTTDADGKPIVDNAFRKGPAEIGDEARQYTFFVLNDAAWETAQAALKPYFATESADSTAGLAAWALAKDLAVEGVYPLASLPDTLTSTTGIKIPVHKNTIVRSYAASNGIVYVLDQAPTPLPLKFKPVIIEGEKPSGFSRTDKAANIFYRVKSDPAGNVFKDIQVYGHATPLFYIQYKLADLPSGTYKIYWRAVAGNNDAQTVAFQQRLAFNTADATQLAYTNVALNNYQEVYVGQYTVTRYGLRTVYLVAANSGTAGVNTLSLDYLKLELTF